MAEGSEERFAAYVTGLVGVIGHVDRAGPLRDYCLGLLMPGDRKSVEPLAAVTAPARVSAQHQSLLHFVGKSAWSDERLLARVRELVLPGIERQGPVEAWIVDDTIASGHAGSPSFPLCPPAHGIPDSPPAISAWSRTRGSPPRPR